MSEREASARLQQSSHLIASLDQIRRSKMEIDYFLYIGILFMTVIMVSKLTNSWESIIDNVT